MGETLLTIVPSGNLEAKIFITNTDIGFIKNSMKAEVRIDAYPFTQFGSMEGELKFVGNETLQANEQYPYTRYPAYVQLKNQSITKNDKEYALRSGQTVSVNFLVREKPVISLLTDSVEKAWDALRGIKSEQI